MELFYYVISLTASEISWKKVGLKYFVYSIPIATVCTIFIYFWRLVLSAPNQSSEIYYLSNYGHLLSGLQRSHFVRTRITLFSENLSSRKSIPCESTKSSIFGRSMAEHTQKIALILLLFRALVMIELHFWRVISEPIIPGISITSNLFSVWNIWIVLHLTYFVTACAELYA